MIEVVVEILVEACGLKVLEDVFENVFEALQISNYYGKRESFF